MANLMDYLDWRGDLQISERGFNEVDNLLLAELCYLDFGGIVAYTVLARFILQFNAFGKAADKTELTEA